MIRAVIDTNVFASGVLGLARAQSIPGEIFRQWRKHAFLLITEQAIIDEVERVLATPFLVERIPASESAAAVDALRQDAVLTVITTEIRGIATHPEDDVVLAIAVSAAADFLVTGDKQVQRLETYQGVRIVSPREFLAFLPVPD